MPTEKRDNVGILFRNDDKKPEKPECQKWCDFEGSMTLEGKRYWISAWIKESKKDGRKFFSLSFKPAKPKT